MLHWPGYGSLLRTHRIRSVLIMGNWDIVGLCEVWSESLRHVLLDDVELRKKYPFIIDHIRDQNDGNKNCFGLVILSKFPIKNFEIIQYQNTLHPIFPLNLLADKGTIYAEIEVNSKIIGVFVTHLYWGRTGKQIGIRYEQLKELRALADSKREQGIPIITLGDFNMMQQEYSKLEKEFAGYRDWWKQTHDLKVDPGITWSTQNTFVYFLIGNYRYDYILSTKEFNPISTRLVKPTNKVPILPWNPIKKLKLKYRIYYQTIRFLRWSFYPFGLIFHLSRCLQKHPSGLFNPMDLSDHYALEGIAELG
ncbi:MAG: endonuclease/exonuclease/phosphatase family protein [Candidatus Kariarchaeaceae archaeon]